MKVLSKPLSSPSRAEKFPPPLMRFLRSNVGSRSRGRSRSSPMFYLRSRRSAPAAIQEPSSPKVTCIGQVRVRRSAKSKPSAAAVKRRRWWRLNSALCFGKKKTSPKLRTNPFRRMFCNCKCGSIFGCRKVDSRDSFRVNSDSRSAKIDKLDAGSNGHCSSNGNSGENQRGILETSTSASASASASSPPKNALMLTRCRSAPYRSSSLGGRFWGSPLAEKEDDEEDGNKTADNDGKLDDELPGSSNILVKEEENDEENVEEENVEEIMKIGVGAVHPLLLTRCKSEPARIGERLSAEAILLKPPTRLAAADDDDHHHHHLVQQNA